MPLAAALLAISAALCPGAAADAVEAVAISSPGILTKCRSWVLFNSCKSHKVALPERVAVGDQIELSYGSNPKSFTFPVRRIVQHGSGCTIFSQAGSAAEQGDKIEVAGCQPTAPPGAAAR
jgi:hypothetical protein